MNSSDGVERIMKTKGCANSADVCRANGWRAGTRLEGDEGYGPTVMEITAVGNYGILGKTISHNGTPRNGWEHSWTLSCRDWKEVSVTSSPEQEEGITV